MFTPTSRVRTRSETPQGPRGVVKLGQVFIENGPNTNDWKPLGAPKDGLFDATWSVYERTKDELHGKPPYKTGGPFERIKIDRSGCVSGPVGQGTYVSKSLFNYSGYYGRVRYVGGFMPPDLSTMGISGLNISNQSLLDSMIPDVRTLGSQVWDRLKPKIEQGGLFVAIAEAKDIPRMLHTTASGFHELWSSMGGHTKSRLMQPKFVADQFLNQQFGWIPFIKDVNDFLSNIVNYTDRIHRLANENGQWIRRRATMVNNNDSKPISSGTGSYMYPTNVIGGVNWALFYDPAKPYVEPYWEVREDTTTFSTAVGSFRYWLPEFAGPSSNPLLEKLNAVRRTIDLFGLRASPSNIYKAIPWTWLIDWVSGFGRSLQALQDETLDNMVANYMSLSHHKITTRVFRQVLPFTGENGGTKAFEYSQITDIKQRVMASSPFGMYLDASGLTSRQYAILGALGLSRKRWGRH